MVLKILVLLLVVGAFCGYRIGHRAKRYGENDLIFLKTLAKNLLFAFLVIGSHIAYCANTAAEAPNLGRITEYLAAYGGLGLVCVLLSYCLSYALVTEPEFEGQ